ncbi:10646_t:CDS:2 [Dentiscutata heterogama]|uniref:10646_t:CDS:1 n=1 Tax=Dentiscutata heterogama TaxID=1316150 RepID=A0ACA9LGH0_9GLOM|nr:10646_t:CDS:2 [Dentiscutata heterogama]
MDWTFVRDDFVRRSTFARVGDAYHSWGKEFCLDFDLILHLEDYLQMTGKVEFISSQIAKISI